MFCIQNRLAALFMSLVQVCGWYSVRARQLCDESRLPCLALELLQQGLEKGVAVDWRLLHAVRTLDTLVYEVQHPGQQVLELAELELLPDLQQVCGVVVSTGNGCRF